MAEHSYAARVAWTGDLGTGTSGYEEYSRAHVISAPGKPDVVGSSDSAFRGDATRWNPEETLVAALSTCHLLMYLDLCARSGVVVVGYEDDASGVMEESDDGGGQFREVVLRPRVTIADAAMAKRAKSRHERAHSLCFIARSVNFPVRHEPVIVAASDPGTEL